MVWMTSRVSGSIDIGPRGLSHFMPLAAAISESPSVLPLVFAQRRVDQVHAVIAADREEVGIALEVGVVGLDEALVQRVVEIVVVIAGGDDAERVVAHAA